LQVETEEVITGLKLYLHQYVQDCSVFSVLYMYYLSQEQLTLQRGFSYTVHRTFCTCGLTTAADCIRSLATKLRTVSACGLTNLLQTHLVFVKR